MFSTPTKESPADDSHTAALKGIFPDINTKPVKLSLRVEDMEQARVAIAEGVDRIYLSADVFQPKEPFTIPQIKTLSAMKESTELYLTTPRMMDAVQFDRYRQWLDNLLRPGEAAHGSGNPLAIDGLLVTNLGAIEAFKHYGLRMIGDYSLNIFNTGAARFYLKEGLSEITPSIELPGEDLNKLLKEDIPFEVITHGKLASMYMAYDLYKEYGIDPKDPLLLENEAGQYQVKRDVFGKSHLLMQKHYTLLPVAERLHHANVRIEAQMETGESLQAIIRAHKSALNGAENPLEELARELPGTEYTFGATRF